MKPGRVLRAAALTAASALGLTGLAWLVLTVFPALQYTGVRVAMFAAFSSYGVLAWALAAALLLIAGGRWGIRALAVPCVLALLLQHAWLPTTPPRPRPGATASPLRVLSINLNFGKADPAQLAAEIRASVPDVVVLLEVQQPIVQALTDLEALVDYPYWTGEAPAGWATMGFESDEGTRVYSRTTLTQLERLPTPNGQYVVRVARPAGDVTVIAARPRNMLLGMDQWRDDYAVLNAATARHLDDRLVVAGDLNAVIEHAPLRDLLHLGLADAASLAGRGRLATYPSGKDPLPPLIAIDHVLVNTRLDAAAVRTFRLDGTDHLGVVADLVVLD